MCLCVCVSVCVCDNLSNFAQISFIFERNGIFAIQIEKYLWKIELWPLLSFFAICSLFIWQKHAAVTFSELIIWNLAKMLFFYLFIILWIINLTTGLWPLWVFCFMSLLIFCEHYAVVPSLKIEIWNLAHRPYSLFPKRCSLMFWKKNSFCRVVSRLWFQVRYLGSGRIVGSETLKYCKTRLF